MHSAETITIQLDAGDAIFDRTELEEFLEDTPWVRHARDSKLAHMRSLSQGSPTFSFAELDERDQQTYSRVLCVLLGNGRAGLRIKNDIQPRMRIRSVIEGSVETHYFESLSKDPILECPGRIW